MSTLVKELRFGVVRILYFRLFFLVVYCELIQTLQYIWPHEEGLHTRLEICAAVKSIDVAEIFYCFRVQLSQPLNNVLRCLLFTTLYLTFKFKDSLVEIVWHYELSSQVLF